MTDKKEHKNNDAAVKKTVVNIQPVSDTTVADKTGKGNTATGATEIGGRKGPEPTRYGDWEKNGRCIDF